jgi:hypothetical protein
MANNMSKKRVNSPKSIISNLNRLQKEQLGKIIQMETPAWLTKDIYDDLITNWDKYKLSYDAFESYIINTLNISENKMNKNEFWESISFGLSSEIIFNMWNDGMIISTPATGQDPKYFCEENLEIASKYAAHHWGNDKAASWIQHGTFNLVKYPGGKMVFEPVDVEHRIWGLIAFLKGLIALKSSTPLYYSNPALIDGKITVNDLTLSEIVEKCNLNLKPNEVEITDSDIKKRFNSGLFLVTLLPMFSEERCHEYYRTINSAKQKTKPQILHSKEELSNLRIKKFSSIKNERFNASDDSLHPFYKKCFNESSHVSLQSFMISHLIYQFILKDDFVATSDSPIFNYFEKTNGYKQSFDTEMESILISKLDFLYELFKHRGEINPSRQEILQILKLSDYLESENFIIFDTELFIDSFYEFLEENLFETLSNGDKNKLQFAEHMFSSTTTHMGKAFKIIKQKFLGNGKGKITQIDESKLPSLGIMYSPTPLPRCFEQHIIQKSAKDYKNLDIDNTPFTDKPVGGHIISDFELLHLSDEERDELAMKEFDSKFKHNKNCRAMSSYHNIRMSILTLSEYMKIINQSDAIVREAVKLKKKTILKKFKVKELQD